MVVWSKPLNHWLDFFQLFFLRLPKILCVSTYNSYTWGGGNRMNWNSSLWIIINWMEFCSLTSLISLEQFGSVHQSTCSLDFHLENTSLFDPKKSDAPESHMVQHYSAWLGATLCRLQLRWFWEGRRNTTGTSGIEIAQTKSDKTKWIKELH